MKKDEYSFEETSMTTQFREFSTSMKKLSKAVKKMGPGMEALRRVNAEIGERMEKARLLVTDEKVFALMETAMLDYDYARELLESAYTEAARYGEDFDGEGVSEEHATIVGEAT